MYCVVYSRVYAVTRMHSEPVTKAFALTMYEVLLLLAALQQAALQTGCSSALQLISNFVKVITVAATLLADSMKLQMSTDFPRGLCV